MPACTRAPRSPISTAKPSARRATGCSAPTASCPPTSRSAGRAPCRRISTRATRAEARDLPLPDSQPHRALGARPRQRACVGARARSMPRRWPRRQPSCCSASTTSAPSAPPSARRKSPMRGLTRLDVARARRLVIVIECRANAFLHHMVRNIVGSLIAVGTRRAAPRRGARRCSRAAIARAAPPPPPPRGCTSGEVRYPAGLRTAGFRIRRPRCSAADQLMIAAMSWFEKIMPSRIKTERRTRSVPEGLWIKCPACDAVLYRAELERNLYVCPKCSHHMRIGARERLERFLDQGTLGARSVPASRPRIRSSSGQQELPRPPDAGAEGDRRERRAGGAERDAARASRW